MGEDPPALGRRVFHLRDWRGKELSALCTFDPVRVGDVANPAKTTQRLQVRDLQIGDRLWPTGRVVTAAPYRAARCKAGEVRIGIDGTWHIWRAKTQVSTSRAPQQGPLLGE